MKPVEIIPPSNLEWCDMTLKYEVDSSYSNYIHPSFNARYTSVEKISEDKEDNKPYYNLFGVKYSTRPAIPGIYIHNGKKILKK